MVRSRRTTTRPILTAVPAAAPQTEAQKAGSMMSVPRTEWDDYWSRIWSAVWNVIGLVTLVITFVGVCGFIAYGVYDAFQPPSRPKSSPPSGNEKLNYSERLSLQSAFNILLASEKSPCAVKGKGEQYSDVRGCSLFRIALGAYDSM